MDDLNPEEELKKTDRLIHQYQVVSRTTKNDEQRDRVERQIQELRSYRQKILDVIIVDTPPQTETETEAPTQLKHLRRLSEAESYRPTEERIKPLAAEGVPATPVQEEVFNLMMYMRFFQGEFLPVLTEKRLRLDYKFSIERDSFYGRYKDLERSLNDFREANERLSNGTLRRELEQESYMRLMKLRGRIKSDSAKLFRAVHAFCEELIEDADADGVKCLNGSEEIVFDEIEGTRLLAGRRVTDALVVLAGFSSEVVAYLNVPETDGG
ncbi:MAG: hypothetical protein ACHQ1F_02475 [Spirochaetia bacterium]